jgi:hypothetical protein
MKSISFISIVIILAFPIIGAADLPTNYFRETGGEYDPDTLTCSSSSSACKDPVEELDWQKEWGTIHLNTFADGLEDPDGTDAPLPMHSTSNGNVACPGQGLGDSLCKDVVNSINQANPSRPKPQDQLGHEDGSDAKKVLLHGIKFDIKNSLANCMSNPRPNFAIHNAGDVFSNSTCTQAGLSFRNRSDTPVTLKYLPIWDKRSNDTKSSTSGQRPGCQQQVVNNCIQDIHDCRKQSDSPWTFNNASVLGGIQNANKGYRSPITHIFTQEEIADLGGKKIPNKYFSYTKGIEFGASLLNQISAPATGEYVITGDGTPVANPNPCANCPVTVTTKNFKMVTKSRLALSAIDPKDAVDIVLEGGVPVTAVETITSLSDPNYSKFRSRLKTYEINSSVYEYGDMNGFVVVDPKFFDLRYYMNGAKWDAGYDVLDDNGNPKTPNSCPILGMTGYAGICDPTGVAGCNLPIYGIGQTTTFTLENGDQHDYTTYPIIWSGYVKKWTFITEELYEENIAGRKGPNGGELYATGVDLNENAPILMIERSNEYCINNERYSGQVDLSKEPDLPCIQYLQYQNIGGMEILNEDGSVKEVLPNKFVFLDLFQPIYEPSDKEKFVISKMILFDKSNSVINRGSPVLGEGSNRYVGSGLAGNFASFLDITPPTFKNLAPSKDGDIAGVFPAISRETFENLGGLIGTNASETKDDGGVGFASRIENGFVYGMRLFDEGEREKDKSGEIADDFIRSDCAIVKYLFVDATNLDKNEIFVPTNSYAEFSSFLNTIGKIDDNVEVRNCDAEYDEYARFKKDTNPPQNPNGTLTWEGTTSCKQLVDKPACNQAKLISSTRSCILEDGIKGSCDKCAGVNDPDLSVDFSEVAVDGIVTSSPQLGTGQCYFEALCIDQSAAGCPAAGTAGGHVFCLSPDTKILMADGNEKAIIDIKAGEKVKAFKARDSKKAILQEAGIVATAITEEQEIIRITVSSESTSEVLNITPLHKVVLGNGRGVKAEEVVVGDTIITASGDKVVVEQIEKDLPKITVYNLVLEEEYDGYIANGLRILSYPLLDGLKE